MKRAVPWNDQVEISSNESASSDSARAANSGCGIEQPTYDIMMPEIMSEDVLISRIQEADPSLKPPWLCDSIYLMDGIGQLYEGNVWSASPLPHKYSP